MVVAKEMKTMKKLLHGFAAIAVSWCLSAASAAQDYVPPEEMDAETVYGFSCAACHGVDGGGLSPDNPLYQSFESAPADFTDALFNSREPAADWAIVVKYGGARIGLSDEMPAFGEAFSEEQIGALVDSETLWRASLRAPRSTKRTWRARRPNSA